MEIFDKDYSECNSDCSPIFKRHKDTSTLLSTFFQRGDEQMIKLLAPMLLESTSVLAAREIIMSDMFAILEQEEMLKDFQVFFTNDGQDDDFLPKFQMCEPSC